MNQPVGDRLNAVVGAVGVSWRPISRARNFAGLDRSIADGGAGEKPVSEGDRIDERLEGGANLAIGRRQRAIEFALRVIASADQGADAAARVVDRDHAPLPDRASKNLRRSPAAGSSPWSDGGNLTGARPCSGATRAPGWPPPAPRDRAWCKYRARRYRSDPGVSSRFKSRWTASIA